MWDHRSTVLHEHNNSIHPQEKINLKDEIIREKHLGYSSLPNHYKELFTVPLQICLTWTSTKQIEWLFNVWAARETLNPNYMDITINQYSNIALRFRYKKWKEKI